jgi:hypothetical protein
VRDDLAIRSAVSALVAAFNKAEANVRQAFALIVSTQNEVNAAFLFAPDDSGRIQIWANASGHGEDFRKPEEAIKRMTRSAWAAIAERLELRRWLSVRRWKLVEERLNKGPLPAITEENVLAFVQEYAAEAGELVAEAVAEVFDWLRPRGARSRGPGSPQHPDRYQANRAVEIPAKVILMRVVDPATRWGWSPHVNRSAELTALENVFNHLAGRGSITKGYYSELELAIRAAGTRGEAETDLFHVRYFQNGNGHLRFKDAALLRKFNQMAGGKNLRPAPPPTEDDR